MTDPANSSQAPPHGFHILREIATYLHGDGWYFELVEEWGCKRDKLLLQLQDLPVVAREYVTRTQEPDDVEPRIAVSSRIPEIRLSNACESTSNLVYSMAEVAGLFANAATNKRLPKSFNDIVKRTKSASPSDPLTTAVGDLQWYTRVRELRTEWAHYSTPFVSDSGGEAHLVIRAHRRRSDIIHFPKDTVVSVRQLQQWSTDALRALDSFGCFLLLTSVLPTIPLDREVYLVHRTKTGFPQLTPDGRLVTSPLSMRQLLQRLGITGV